MRRQLSLLLVAAMLVGVQAGPAGADGRRGPVPPVRGMEGGAPSVATAPTSSALDEPAGDGAGTYLVQVEDAAVAGVVAQVVDELGGTTVDRVDGAVDVVVVDVPDGGAAVLRSVPGVVRVEADTAFRAAFYSWGVDRVDQRDLPLQDAGSGGGTGRGVTVYVLDSGIDVDHPEFGGRARLGFTAIEDGSGANDCEGHGTAVASAVGGASGVAPDVTLVSVRVLDCRGVGDLSQIIAGLEFVADDAARRRGRAVINLSLGGAVSEVLDDVVRTLVARGVVVVVAAGNEDDDACNYSPGRIDDVLTVGASTRNDERHYASNWGPCVDVFAPGASVRTAEAFTGASSLQTGTSFAAPHVAGIAARYLELEPGATVEAVHAAVVAGATTNRLRGTQGLHNRLAYARLGPGREPVGSATSCDAAAGAVASSTLATGESVAAPSTGGRFHPAGLHEACLRGVAGTDHDLYLERLVDGAWQVVAASTSEIGSDERVVHSGPAGTYRWVVQAFSGGGAAVLDWNGPGLRTRTDAAPELLSFHGGDGSWWSTHVGTGAQREVTTFASRRGWQAHLAGDLTGDDREEVASFHAPRGRWWRTDPTSGAQRLVAEIDTTRAWAAHVGADVDGDGTTDLLSYDGATGTWWVADVADADVRRWRLTTYGTIDGWQSHLVTDLDGDGVDELASYHAPSGRWWSTVVRGDGRAVSRLVTTYGTPDGWATHLVGDVDGDGADELLSHHRTSGRWWSTDVRPDGRVAQRLVTTYGTRTGWQGHVTADTDEDGTDDIVSFNAEDGAWWRTGMRRGRSGPTRVLATFGTRDGWVAHLTVGSD